jgi:chemotaxis regulatin CheY-phosphate phosphatase CheZ
MEKAEITRLIDSFNAIKGYFDTTKRYMPQIAKLVFFIEEVIPLLQTIHKNLHVSTEMIPSASEKLGKVTSATELATTEVMDIVDNVIARLNTMSTYLDEIEEQASNPASGDLIKGKISDIRNEISGSQDDLFSIMNALQFQDITTQQINSIGSVIDSVHTKLTELLKGFDEEGLNLGLMKQQSFDPDAEFDFSCSAESQQLVDEFIKLKKKGVDIDTVNIDSITADTQGTQDSDLIDMVILGEDGQPKIDLLIDRLKSQKNDKK